MALKKNKLTSSLSRRDLFVCALVFILLAGLSLNFALFAGESIHARAYSEFKEKSKRVETDIARRLQTFSNKLIAIKGVFNSKSDVSRSEFESYLNNTDSVRNSELMEHSDQFPKSLNVSYIRRISANQKQVFIQETKSDRSLNPAGYPAFQIYPETEKQNYFPITYSHFASEGNDKYLGQDVSAIPDRWKYYEKARDTGRLMVTARLTHAPMGKPGYPSFLIIVPIYQNGMPLSTLEERRNALIGFVSILYSWRELLSGVASEFNVRGFRELEIYDGKDLVYDGENRGGGAAGPGGYESLISEQPKYDKLFYKVVKMKVDGQNWELRFYGSPKRNIKILYRWLPWVIFLGGGGLSFIIVVLLYYARSAQFRAEKLARKMTEELRLSVGRFDLAMQASNDGLWEWGLKEQCYFSPRYKQLLGYSEFKMGDTLSSFKLLLHPDDHDKTFAEMDRHIKDKTPYDDEFRLKHINGEYRWFQARAQAEWHPITGEAIRVVGSIHDLTTRKKSELELAQLAAIVESTEDSIVGKSLEGIIQSWNKGAEKIYGYTSAESVGRSIEIIIPSEKLSEFKMLTHTIVQNKSTDHRQTVRVRKDGKLIDVALTMSVVLDSKGKLIGISEISRDITNEKTLEQQLQQAQKMEAVGKLAGGISHDFNNLLTVINGYSEMLLSTTKKDNADFARVEQIFKAGSRAAELTSQLLSFSRKQMTQPKVVNLNDLVLDIDQMLHQMLTEAVEVIITSAKDLWMVKVDPGQVHQVLLNLAANARDSMPQGGKFFVQTANVVFDNEYVHKRAYVAAGEYVMLAVTDTGVGMSLETKARIFEPFFTTKGLGKGTGLGLATCYGIVKQAHGSIEVYSELEHGTTFKIYFPREAESSVTDSKKTDVVMDASGVETIMLVEDESSVRDFAKSILIKRGYKVIEAGHGEQAFEMISTYESKIDLLVTDVVMPGMSGRDLFKKIQPLRPDLKVLFMSGYTEEVVLRHAIQNNSVNFLQKPFTVNNFLLKVREVLDAA